MCTNIALPIKDENDPVISARSMDYAGKLTTIVNLVPRGQAFPEFHLPGETHWISKYGFIGMGHPTQGIPMIHYSDGLNEAGLSAAALWLPLSTYPHPGPDSSILCNINLVGYILGNFRNIREVKDALLHTAITDSIRSGISERFPLHYIISDASGEHLIVEFINGEMFIHKNKSGLLTNEPSYEWHLTNLGNYENLSIKNSSRIFMGTELNGSGQIGSPGDPTPASRFVRAAFLRKTAFHPKTIRQSIGLALQMLQTLSIPKGTVIKNNSENQSYHTHWYIIRDHTNCSIYFCTAFNSRLYGIHLKQLKFTGLEQKRINILRNEWYQDITGRFEPIYDLCSFILQSGSKCFMIYRSKLKAFLKDIFRDSGIRF